MIIGQTTVLNIWFELFRGINYRKHFYIINILIILCVQGGDVPESFEDYYTGADLQICLSEEGAWKGHQKNGECFTSCGEVVISLYTFLECVLHLSIIFTGVWEQKAVPKRWIWSGSHICHRCCFDFQKKPWTFFFCLHLINFRVLYCIINITCMSSVFSFFRESDCHVISIIRQAGAL